MTDQEQKAIFDRWCQPSTFTPNLPKFERRMLIKHGRNIKVKTAQKLAKDTREANAMERGHGRQPKQVNNLAFGKVLSHACIERISVIIRSFDTAATHKGAKLLPMVIIHLLQTYEILHRKRLEWDYGYTSAHAGIYMLAIEDIVTYCGQQDLESVEDDEIIDK